MFATAGDKKKIQSVLDKLNGHFEPLKSEVLDQLKFLRRHQQPGESFDSWVVCLRGLVHIVDLSKACDIVRARDRGHSSHKWCLIWTFTTQRIRCIIWLIRVLNVAKALVEGQDQKLIAVVQFCTTNYLMIVVVAEGTMRRTNVQLIISRDFRVVLRAISLVDLPIAGSSLVLVLHPMHLRSILQVLPHKRYQYTASFSGRERW